MSDEGSLPPATRQTRSANTTPSDDPEVQALIHRDARREARGYRSTSVAAVARKAAHDPNLRHLYNVFHDPNRDPASQELLIVAQAIVLCGLPYKRLDVPHYVREAKTARGLLRVTFSTADPAIPIAFGQDRAVLAWLTTKATQIGDPTVTWDTSGEFFDTFGLDKGGKSYRLFYDRWIRLANLAIKVERYSPEGVRGKGSRVLGEWFLPSVTAVRHQTRLPGQHYSVTFSKDFFDDLKRWHIPLPLPVMREFLDEPKAWDFASFVVYRSWLCEAARRNGRPGTARISMTDLRGMLGSTDKDDKRLRKTLRAILARFLTVWPEGQASFDGSVLEVEPPRGGVHLVLPRVD